MAAIPSAAGADRRSDRELLEAAAEDARVARERVDLLCANLPLLAGLMGNETLRAIVQRHMDDVRRGAGDLSKGVGYFREQRARRRQRTRGQKAG